MKIITDMFVDLSYAVSEETLKLTFMEGLGIYNPTSTLNDLIFETVIKPKVFKDWHLLGGLEISVDLNLCEVLTRQETFTVVKIPKSLTGQRSILNPLLVRQKRKGTISHAPDDTNYGANTNSSGSVFLNTAEKAVNAIEAPSVYISSSLTLIGPNTVSIDTPLATTNNLLMDIEIANNLNLVNLNSRYSQEFSDFCILAIQAYIYRKLKIPLGKGAIVNGYEISEIKEEVSEFADALKDYNDMRKNKIPKIINLNNNKLTSDLYRTAL